MGEEKVMMVEVLEGLVVVVGMWSYEEVLAVAVVVWDDDETGV